MLFLLVLAEVQPFPFEFLSLDVADEAKVFIVFVHGFLLASHVCEGVDYDTADDGGDD